MVFCSILSSCLIPPVFICINGLVFPALSRATMLLILIFFFRIVAACSVLLLLSSLLLYLIKISKGERLEAFGIKAQMFVSPFCMSVWTGLMGVRRLGYLIIVWVICIRITDAQLSENFYSKTCPNVEALVLGVAKQKLAEAPVSAPATIRLLFHDCFVDGCDASVLISSTPKHLAERDAADNKNLAADAFDAVNRAKAAVEAKCPHVVSCADILAIAARDFVALTGGPNYPVKKGRKDGRISIASRVRGNLPEGNFTVDLLLKTFASKGLNKSDMVALSGAHTIGFSHCDGFLDRLYNYHRTNLADPSMDPRLLKALKMSCPRTGGNSDIITPFDVNTPFAFDNMYYKNLQLKMGLLGTDQALFSDPRTNYLVQYFANYKTQFFQAFSVAMDKMSSIGVKTGNQGEIRKICTQINV